MRLEDVQVRVVGDEVRGAAVQRAEEEGDVVGILGVVAEVEGFDENESAVQRERGQEAVYRGLRSAGFRQLFRILGDDVGGVEKGELAALLTIQNIDIRTGRVARMLRGKHHIRIEDSAEGHGYRCLEISSWALRSCSNASSRVMPDARNRSASAIARAAASRASGL